MLVSHDRALLRAVCDEFWMVSQGGVAPFDGDLDDYQKYLLDHAKRQREEAKKSGSTAPATAATPVVAKTVLVEAPPTSVKDTPEQRKLDAKARQQQSEANKPLRQELEKIDSKIQALQNEKTNLQALLTTTTVPAEMAQAGKRLKAIETETGAIEERWLQLTEQIETA